MQGNILNHTEKGIPQGGFINPILANIALYGLEKLLNAQTDKSDRVRGSKVYVRYADDFIVLYSPKQEQNCTKKQISNWEGKKGLRISPHKLHIKHIQKGFDFLGFNFRQYNTKHPSVIKSKVLLVKPNRKRVNKITQKLQNKC